MLFFFLLRKLSGKLPRSLLSPSRYEICTGCLQDSDLTGAALQDKTRERKRPGCSLRFGSFWPSLSLSFPVVFPSRGRNPPYFSTFPLNRNALKINIAERPGGPEAPILSPREPLSVLLCLLLTYLLNIFLKDLLPFSDTPPMTTNDRKLY